MVSSFDSCSGIFTTKILDQIQFFGSCETCEAVLRLAQVVYLIKDNGLPHCM
jgi:hypothetical protein